MQFAREVNKEVSHPISSTPLLLWIIQNSNFWYLKVPESLPFLIRYKWKKHIIHNLNEQLKTVSPVYGKGPSFNF